MKTRVGFLYEPGYNFWISEGRKCAEDGHWGAAASAYTLARGLAPTTQQKYAATVLRDHAAAEYEKRKDTENGTTAIVRYARRYPGNVHNPQS